MKNQELFAEAMKAAQREEQRTGHAIKEVYIYDGGVYFNKYELKGKQPDFTLVRSDMDENFKSDISDKKVEKRGF